MKQTTLALISAVLSLGSATAWAHGDQRLGIEPENQGAFSAGTIGYYFQLLDLEKRTVLSDSDIEVSQSKKVHVFVYDPALKHLQHLHAAYHTGLWHADVPISKDGNYWIWAEGQLASDHTTGYGSSRLLVVGSAPGDTSAPDVRETRTGSDGTSQVILSGDPIVKKQEVMLGVTFSRTDGSKPNVTPYLGEMGHAVLVSEDGDWLSHAHVMTDDMGMLTLHAKFPEEGNYRVWIQYMDGGTLRLVSLAVSVADTR